MKETKFYHAALNMALLDGRSAKAALDERIARQPLKSKERIAFPWRRVGMAAAERLRGSGLWTVAVVGDGSFTNGNVTPAAEFNILADAEAASVCFRSGRPITMVGLDVTRKALCYPEIVERMGRIGNRASNLFVALMGHFCKTQKKIFGWEGGPLHDPVTIAYLIDPEVLVTKPMNVQIDIRSTQSYGRTNCDYYGYQKLPPTADVAVDIDVARFWDIVETGLRRYSEA